MEKKENTKSAFSFLARKNQETDVSEETGTNLEDKF